MGDFGIRVDRDRLCPGCDRYTRCKLTVYKDEEMQRCYVCNTLLIIRFDCNGYEISREVRKPDGWRKDTDERGNRILGRRKKKD